MDDDTGAPGLRFRSESHAVRGLAGDSNECVTGTHTS
jgi:hypothetical protein